MSSLLLQPSRSSQPQGGAQIAPKWAQKFPVLVATGSSGFTNLVNGLPPALGSTANFRGSSVGIGASGSASSTTSTIGFEDYAFGGTTPITVIAFSDDRPSAIRSFLAQGTEVILRMSSAGTGVEFILNSFSTNDRATAVADSRSSPGFFAAGTYGPSGRLRAYANTAMAEVTPTGAYANSSELFTAIYTQGLNQLFDKRLALLAIFRSELSPAELRELSASPWQLFKPVERRIWVPASTGGSVGNASGSLSSITTAAASAVASGAAQSAAACASLSITPAEASASGGVSVVGNASASLASLSLSAASASASGLAAASSALAGISVAPASAVASGGASVPATASASLASLSTAPATATASGAATAAGAMLGMNLTPAQAQATAAAWAAAELRALSIAPATATAGDGSAAPWPAGRADPQHLAVVPFAGVRAMVPAADLRAAVPFTGVRAIVQQDTP